MNFAPCEEHFPVKKAHEEQETATKKGKGHATIGITIPTESTLS